MQVNATTGLRVDSERETAQARILLKKAELKEAKDNARAMSRYSWEWVDGWLAQHCKSPRTLDAYRLHWRHIQHWLSFAGITSPREITHRHGVQYVEWRTGRRANHKTCGRNTAILELKLLGQILTQAALEGEIPANPLFKLGIARDEPEPKRELTDEELERCLAFLDRRDEAGQHIEEEWMRLAFLIGLHTGCRLRETALVMANVSFERRTITFGNPKGGRKKAFTRPLPEALYDVLWAIRDREVSHEFPFQPSRCWQNFFQRAGVENVSFHCLRVTYVTRLHRAAVPLSAAMRLANHSSEIVHRIYQRLNVDDVRPYADVQLFSTKIQTPSGEGISRRGEKSGPEPRA